MIAAPQNQDHENRGRAHQNASAELAAPVGCDSRVELPIARSRADDADQSDGQHQRHHQQKRTERDLHRFRSGRDGRHRNGKLAGPMIAIGLNADLPRSRSHHPQRAGEKLGIVFGTLQLIGRRRELRTVAGERRRRHAKFPNGRRRAANLDFGDAGNHGGRPDGHIQGIGARRSFQKHVRRADVRLRKACEKNQNRRAFHRLMVFIQLPQANPTRAIMTATTAAIIRRVVNPVSSV
jgi:hypothetical protein